MSTSTNTNVDPQGSATTRTASPPLQRGKACLSCRRRKMKCDGARPICTPCLRGERSEDCEYTDGQRRPRMLALEEDVARLRARLRELENPEEAIPSVELFAPYGSASPSTGGSPYMSHTQVPQSDDTADARRMDAEADMHSRRALSVIAPYAAELGLFLDIDRLRVQGTHVVPALQSTLTLWSVHITSTSEPGHGQALERAQPLASRLLSRAQTQLAFALSTADAEPDSTIFLQLIQAGVLLAYYLQRVGQVVGARYYASGTWTLGMMLKLSRNPYLPVPATGRQSQSQRGGGAREGRTHGVPNVCAYVFSDCERLARALDGIEAEERVRAFWAVYTLDRWFSAVGQWPYQSLDGNTLTVPWPNAGGQNEARNVVRHLLSDPNHDFLQDGPSAMLAKASVLLGEARSIAASYVADNTISQSTAFQARFGMLDTLLRRCLNAAMSLATGQQSQAPERAQALVTVHQIAFAYVALHRPFISASHGSHRRRCAEAAFGVIRVLDRMREAGVGVGSISPIYATVWTALCVSLHDEVLRLRARRDADPSRRREESEMVGAIRKLVGLLSALSQHYPSRFFAVKIEAVLPILESIAA